MTPWPELELAAFTGFGTGARRTRLVSLAVSRLPNARRKLVLALDQEDWLDPRRSRPLANAEMTAAAVAALMREAGAGERAWSVGEQQEMDLDAALTACVGSAYTALVLSGTPVDAPVGYLETESLGRFLLT